MEEIFLQFDIEKAAELTRGEKEVYKLIVSEETEEGCLLSNSELAKKLGYKENHIGVILGALQFMEYIIIEHDKWVKGMKYKRVIRTNDEY